MMEESKLEKHDAQVNYEPFNQNHLPPIAPISPHSFGYNHMYSYQPQMFSQFMEVPGGHVDNSAAQVSSPLPNSAPGLTTHNTAGHVPGLITANGVSGAVANDDAYYAVSGGSDHVTLPPPPQAAYPADYPYNMGLQFSMSSVVLQSSPAHPPPPTRTRSYPDTRMSPKLRRHKRRNTDPHGLSLQEVSRNRCTTCDKEFKRPSSLQTHLYSHTGEKPFACQWGGCNRQFSVRSNMTRHMKLHQRDSKRSSKPEENHHHQQQEPVFEMSQPMMPGPFVGYSVGKSKLEEYER